MKRSRESLAPDARAARKDESTRRRKIDFSDILELSSRQLSSMRRVGRPPLGDRPRKLIAIRLDPKVLEWVRKTADKRDLPYQTLINDILAHAMKQAS